MGDRTPNDAYFKSRRALVVSSGLLALSLLSGITPDHTDGSLTFFSLRLNSPENIPLIFLVITVYLIWQLWSAWLVQADEVRRSPVNRLDVFLSFLIAFCAIGIWIWPYLLQAIDFVSGDRWGRIATTTVAVLLGAIVSNISSYLLLKASTRAREMMLAKKIASRTSREREQEQKNFTDGFLTGKDWLLIFNPKNNKSKRISFLPDRTIGSGNNHNEHSWRISDGLLEILNNEGRVFSRFKFNDSLSVFQHTNDADTLSIREQVILPAPA